MDESLEAELCFAARLVENHGVRRLHIPRERVDYDISTQILHVSILDICRRKG